MKVSVTIDTSDDGSKTIILNDLTEEEASGIFKMVEKMRQAVCNDPECYFEIVADRF